MSDVRCAECEVNEECICWCMNFMDIRLHGTRIKILEIKHME